MTREYKPVDKTTAKPKSQTKVQKKQKDQGPEGGVTNRRPLTANNVLHIQNVLGNSVAQRLVQRNSNETSEVDESTAEAINRSRGQGQKLDSNIAEKAGAALGQDFSDVTVHTDAESDELNQAVSAKAFTTGNDIYFSEGAYDPSSSTGQHLISHELTHVVQQGASTPDVQGKMTVNDPGDAYEKEADSVADKIMSQGDLQREEVPEDEELMMSQADVQREEAMEEDEELMMSQADVQREEAMEEDEELMMSQADVQREEAMEEDEELMMSQADVQREEAMEEDELQG